MKSIKMKGKTVEEATEAAYAVLGVEKGKGKVKVINEGKPAMMGIIGGEEAEVELVASEGFGVEARETLQKLLDMMGMLAAAEIVNEGEGEVSIAVKGEDMGRIIGKEGAMLKSLEVIIGAMTAKIAGERIRVHIDAGGYREKRVKSLERLAAEIADEVESTGVEKVLPYMEAADRRAMHVYLANNPKITTFSKGEGKERRLVIAPKQ
ncbi:MAG: KH domain-containing protein [Candidatus Margulisbacteria bacterium]|jgi:spoIIIJ-associated protein|nr:KH domain-containing protein [Candidatus Margulisiibacteriota bacterium]